MDMGARDPGAPLTGFLEFDRNLLNIWPADR